MFLISFIFLFSIYVDHLSKVPKLNRAAWSSLFENRLPCIGFHTGYGLTSTRRGQNPTINAKAFASPIKKMAAAVHVNSAEHLSGQRKDYFTALLYWDPILDPDLDLKHTPKLCLHLKKYRTKLCNILLIKIKALNSNYSNKIP